MCGVSRSILAGVSRSIMCGVSRSILAGGRQTLFIHCDKTKLITGASFKETQNEIFLIHLILKETIAREFWTYILKTIATVLGLLVFTSLINHSYGLSRSGLHIKKTGCRRRQRWFDQTSDSLFGSYWL
jgi:hypothetical protein